MARSVTIQDIADALGLSRNTVSKAINNTGILAETTRVRVLQKAMEMGYKTFSYVGNQPENHAVPPAPVLSSEDSVHSRKNISLFTGMFLDNSHFASSMMDKFQYELSLLGYSLTMYRIMPQDFEERKLPLSFQKENTDAIVCVEIFDYSYCQMLCGLGLPLLLVDAPVRTYAYPLPADILLMENASGIYRIIKTAKMKGISKIGFIGQATHCRSFFERYMAFREAMYLYSLPIVDSYCLTEIHSHGGDYREYLRSHIREMKGLPELFICANDFILLDMLGIIKEMGMSCPKDILFSGFDDSPESRVVTPPLTTCHIHSQLMGLSAVQLVIGRISQPGLSYRIMHTETELIFRESTRGEFNDA